MPNPDRAEGLAHSAPRPARGVSTMQTLSAKQIDCSLDA